MMGGKDKPHSPLSYSFNPDEVVPQDHLLRQIDRFLDLSDLGQHLAPYYSHTGRPSVDPEMLFAHMKRVLKMDRLRLRGLSGARDEFQLTATAQNLRRMAKYRGTDPPGVPEMA